MSQEKSALDLYFEAHPRMVPDVGCYVGTGWEPAVLHALELIRSLSEETGIWVQPRQIKEKLGSLRFYVQVMATDKVEEEEDDTEILEMLRAKGFEIPPAPPRPVIPVVSSELLASVRQRVGAIVRQAEETTSQLCENCGAPEERMSRLRGYICRRCPACIDAGDPR